MDKSRPKLGYASTSMQVTIRKTLFLYRFLYNALPNHMAITLPPQQCNEVKE
jgi:hypothetical protein